MPDNPKRTAVLFGPIVLAADLGPAAKDRVAPVMVAGGRGSLLDKTPTVTMVPIPEQRLMPVIVAKSRPVQEWLTPIQGRQLVFHTAGAGRPKDLELIPLYQIHNRRYSVYWEQLTEKEWRARAQTYRIEQQRLETEGLRPKP